MITKIETMWCVRCIIKSTGYLNTSTIERTRKDAINTWLDIWDGSAKPHYKKWKHWYKRGYRVVKVTVQEVPQ